MSKNDDRGQLNFSRRKLLGSVATLGAAGAIGGAGTMAFFSDTEEFANNQLTAGALDLKVDWQEHYSDWSEDEDDGFGNTILMEEPADPTMYTGFPLSAPVKSLWVHNDDLATFMANTSVEAYPDHDDDNEQDPFAANPGETTPGGVGYVCEDGADTPEDLDPNGGTGLRTNNPSATAARGEATVDENGEPLPVVYINDVKPGDFGEVTYSFHLCDNPGYVWLQGELVEELTGDNSFTEPELKDPQEDGLDTSELLDALRVSVWYDYEAGADARPVDRAENGDNIPQVGPEQYIVQDVEIGDLLGILETDLGLPLDANPAGEGGASLTCQDLGDTLTIPSDAEPGPVSIDSSGGPTNPAVTIDQLREDADGDIGGFDFVFNEEDVDIGTGICEVRVSKDGTTETYNLGCAVDANNVSIINPDSPEIDDLAGATLEFDRCVLDEDDPDRECFEDSSTYYIGFEWYLPVDHANEIQTDSVAWDIGFYTEQCRHNDGSGQPPEDA